MFTEMNNVRSIRDIVADLKKPVAVKHLKKRRQGGKEICYLSWTDAIKYLDHYAPGWDYEIMRIDNIAGKVVLTVRLSITALEGVVYREATGQEDENTDSWGDSTSNSESMALRRAAAKFGLGLYLYDYENPLDYHKEYAAKHQGEKASNGQTQASVPTEKANPAPSMPEPSKAAQNASKGESGPTQERSELAQKKLNALIAQTQKHSLSEKKWAGMVSNWGKDYYEDLTEPEITEALRLISAYLNEKVKEGHATE
jgi:hypothetical protein